MRKIFCMTCFIIVSTFNLFAQVNFAGDTQTEINLNAKAEYYKTDSLIIELCSQIIELRRKDTLFVKNFILSNLQWKNWRETEIVTFFPDYPESNYGTIFPMCYYSKLIEWNLTRIELIKLYFKKSNEFEDSCSPGSW